MIKKPPCLNYKRRLYNEVFNTKVYELQKESIWQFFINFEF
jgi:hypothetical protein